MEYSNYSDKLLLQLIEQKDSEALGELYDRHAQIVFNLIARIVRDLTMADEILQETFWQVWQKAGQLSDQEIPATWLYRIARNKSLEQLRRQNVQPNPESAPDKEVSADKVIG